MPARCLTNASFMYITNIKFSFRFIKNPGLWSQKGHNMFVFLQNNIVMQYLEIKILSLKTFKSQTTYIYGNCPWPSHQLHTITFWAIEEIKSWGQICPPSPSTKYAWQLKYKKNVIFNSLLCTCCIQYNPLVTSVPSHTESKKDLGWKRVPMNDEEKHWWWLQHQWERNQASFK